MDNSLLYDNEKVVRLLLDAQAYFDKNKDYPPNEIADFLVEFCKLFQMMGKLLYFAFSDVIEKAQVIKDRGNEYKESARGIFGAILIEKQKGLMDLNGDNNKDIMGNKVFSSLISPMPTISPWPAPCFASSASSTISKSCSPTPSPTATRSFPTSAAMPTKRP